MYKKHNEIVLLVDDEPDMILGLKRLIQPELNCEVLIAESGQAAMEMVKNNPIDVMVADVSMPDMDGIELMEKVMAHTPAITTVIMTAFGTIDLAVKSLKKGAYDFVTKPFDNDEFLRTLSKSIERSRLLRENTQLQRRLCEREPFENFVGESPPMKKVFETIRMVARTDATVIIRGESGTGKEMAARAIHALSARRQRPMVSVNCPSLPEAILESELFGYRKGAFTHAVTDKKGLLEEAQGSTIFLDEIGDIPISVQTKLLRMIQEKEFKPLGDARTVKADVRILASTNQDLEKKIAQGLFREDLYYRLNVVTLTMPPLRSMKEDIPLLVAHFLKKSACSLGVKPKRLLSEAINLLMEQPWRGNIRELENTLHRAVILSEGEVIQPYHLNLPKRDSSCVMPEADWIDTPYLEAKNKVVDSFTRKYITSLLDKAGGNVTQAAKLSGLKRQVLQKILRRVGVSSKTFREQMHV